MLNFKISKQSLKNAYLGRSSEFETEMHGESSTDRLPDPDIVLLQIILENFQRMNELEAV